MTGMRKDKPEKEIRRLAAAVIAAGLLGNSLPASAEEDIEYDEEILGQSLIISKYQWSGRTLTVEGNGPSLIKVYGGTEQTGAKYTVNVNGNNHFVSAFGGYYDGILEANPQSVNNNTINLKDGANLWVLYDDPKKTDGSYSTLYLNDVRYKELTVNFIAGHAGLGEAAGNTINIYGGTANGYVIAAESNVLTRDTAAERLHDNTINILGKANLNNASLFGAALYNDKDRSRSVFMGTNNTLNTYVKDVVVDELGGFNRYNFYLPASVKNQDVMLDVRGKTQTDISGSSVKALVPNSPYLQVGDKVNLIINNNGIVDSSKTTYIGVNADTGQTAGENASAYYDIITEKQDENHVIVRLAGTVSMKTQTKQIPQIRVPALVNQGGDFMAGGGAASAEASGAQVYTPFFAASGSSMRYTTGSHVDMRGYSMVLGLSKKIENEKRRMLIAPMFEYGKGSYDAYLDGGTHGKGDSHYAGMGLVFRNMQTDGRFWEGSLRGGRMRVNYTSNDFSVGKVPVTQHYNSSAAYYGCHFGVGRDLKLSKNDRYPDHFIYYAKLFYSHTNSDNITLTTGDEYYLSDVDSLRLRLGGKYLYNINEIHKLYLGLAWEREFDGSSYAKYQGARTATPTLRGNSGMVEFGWNYEPKGDNRFSVDLSTTYWFGRQRGITGRLGINWLF